MSLKLETELLAVPHSELRFVRASSKNRLAVSRGCDAVACFWELKVLNELDAVQDLLVLEGRFAFLAFVRRARLAQQIW